MLRNGLMLALTVGAIVSGSLGQAAGQAGGRGNHPEWCDEQGSKNAAERTICATRELWVLDDVLNVTYQETLAVIGGQKSQLVSSQVNWLRNTRNGCGASVGCLTNAYNTRIETLEDIKRRRHM
jgi:uncharacterized protein YecT (DUF1311 family)